MRTSLLCNFRCCVSYIFEVDFEAPGLTLVKKQYFMLVKHINSF